MVSMKSTAVNGERGKFKQFTRNTKVSNAIVPWPMNVVVPGTLGFSIIDISVCHIIMAT